MLSNRVTLYHFPRIHLIHPQMFLRQKHLHTLQFSHYCIHSCICKCPYMESAAVHTGIHQHTLPFCTYKQQILIFLRVRAGYPSNGFLNTRLPGPSHIHLVGVFLDLLPRSFSISTFDSYF